MSVKRQEPFEKRWEKKVLRERRIEKIKKFIKRMEDVKKKKWE